MAVSLTSVVRVLNMDPTMKSILREICDFARNDGTAWPSIRKIMAVTGFSRRTVQIHMRSLRRIGILEKLEGPNFYNDMLIRSSFYRVHLDVAIATFGIEDGMKLPSHSQGAKASKSPQQLSGSSTDCGPAIRH